MTLSEKVANIKGLAEGLNLEDTKEAKLLKAIIDVLEEVSDNMMDVEDDLIELCAQVDEIDEDLANLEEELYEDEDEEDEDYEETFYEVTCPTCEETICLDEETLLDGGIECPSCGEALEFEFECGCNCEDCEDCESSED